MTDPRPAPVQSVWCGLEGVRGDRQWFDRLNWTHHKLRKDIFKTQRDETLNKPINSHWWTVDLPTSQTVKCPTPVQPPCINMAKDTSPIHGPHKKTNYIGETDDIAFFIYLMFSIAFFCNWHPLVEKKEHAEILNRQSFIQVHPVIRKLWPPWTTLKLFLTWSAIYWCTAHSLFPLDVVWNPQIWLLITVPSQSEHHWVSWPPLPSCIKYIYIKNLRTVATQRRALYHQRASDWAANANLFLPVWRSRVRLEGRCVSQHTNRLYNLTDDLHSSGMLYISTDTHNHTGMCAQGFWIGVQSCDLQSRNKFPDTRGLGLFWISQSQPHYVDMLAVFFCII